MKIIKIFLIFILSILDVFSWGGKDFVKEARSPIDSKTSRNVLYTGAATTLLLATVLEDHIVDPTQTEFKENNKLGIFDTPIELMGRVVPNALYTAGMFGHYYFSNDKGKTSFKNAEIMIKATAYASLVTTVLKYTIRQPRPDSSGKNSFPSGHTTTAFAFASVVGARHSWYYGVPSYILASLVAMQRINGNRHYLHDVAAGATIGTVFGIGLSNLLDEKSSLSSRLQIYPLPEKGLALNYRYRF